jgi:predicted DNA-binding mobile mystery protein A
MRVNERECLRQEMDEALLPFRLVRKRKGSAKKGWVKSIRQAIGMPVDELARRMGVCRWEIVRLEKSEESQRIMLSTLHRAAEGLGCELVYALVPKEGALEEMAAAQTRVREKAKAQELQEHEAAKQVYLDFIGWRPMVLKALRAILRREGYRVRMAKTDRNVAKEIDNFLQNVRVLKVAGMLGGFMKQFMEEQEEMKKDREQGSGVRDQGSGIRDQGSGLRKTH